ncbi:hypothetical protein [Pasteurella sp. PK-2025]|uniref:hypothetical protein n=1 Tax=Pasteurella sp. PK-2025 TaxID=3413133 RepID=UPI003C72EC02
MQTANIKVNVKKANELMFYFKDSHDCFLTLAKQSKNIAERVQHAEKASLCRRYYKNASDFARIATH